MMGINVHLCNVFLIVAQCIVLGNASPTSAPGSPETRAIAYEYGVVIDAGSSGSRVRVYRWPARSRQQEIPHATQIFTHKVRPGLSDYADRQDEIQAYVEGLLEQATANVPEEQRATSAIYFMATAGMRLLAERTANEMMETVDKIIKDSTRHTFVYKSTSTRIMSGEEEGAFAWISLNQISGFLSGNTDSSSGVLELGGASAQIAFMPSGSLLANKFPIFLDGHDYPLYVHSYLAYGGTASVNWVFDDMISHGGQDADVIENPCMLAGDQSTYIKDPVQRPVVFQGTGDAAQCMTSIRHLIYDVKDYRCNPKPCAIGSVYQPSLPEDMTFYAISAFAYTANDMALYDPDIMLDDNTLRLQSLNATTIVYCKETFDAMVTLYGSEDYISDRCFKGVYMYSLFHDGYGFSADTNQIKIAKTVDGLAVSWSRGALIYETQHLPLQSAI